MSIIKMSVDKSLTVTISTDNYQFENLAENLSFLIPKTYNNIDLSTCTILLNLIGTTCDPKEKEHKTPITDVILLDEIEEYNDTYFSCKIPVTKNFTFKPLTYKLWLTFLNSKKELVLKTGSCSVRVSPTDFVEEYMSESQLSLIDTWEIKMEQTYSKVLEMSLKVETNTDITTKNVKKTEDILSNVQSVANEFKEFSENKINDMQELFDNSMSEIRSEKADIENLISQGIVDINNSKDNTLNEFESVKNNSLEQISIAKDIAINTINSVSVSKAMLADDIYKPVNNLITSDIYKNTFEWNKANISGLNVIFGASKEQNINITLIQGHKYYIKTFGVFESQYYNGRYANITFNCNSINNSNYSAEARRIQLTDLNDYFDLGMSGGKNYKTVSYREKYLISLHNVLEMKQDMTIFTMALYQQGQGLDRTIPLKIYIIDVTDLSESEIEVATNNLADYEQQEVIYLFAEPRLFAVEEKIKSLENAILSLGGNV